MDDILKSLKATLYDRLSNPFSGALIISWIAWNWKAIYYLFYGEGTVIYKTEYIHDNFYKNLWNPWSDGFTLNPIYLPFLSALFITLIYPWVTNKIYSIWLTHKESQRNIKNKIENNRLLTLEESLEYVNTLRDKDIELSNIVNQKNTQIKALEGRIDISKEDLEELNRLRIENHKMTKSLDQSEIQNKTLESKLKSIINKKDYSDLSKIQLGIDDNEPSKLMQKRIAEEEMEQKESKLIPKTDSEKTDFLGKPQEKDLTLKDVPIRNLKDETKSSAKNDKIIPDMGTPQAYNPNLARDNKISEWKEFKNSKHFEQFKLMYQRLKTDRELEQYFNMDIINYFVLNLELLVMNHEKFHLYNFTEKGKEFLKFYLEEIELDTSQPKKR